MGAFIAYWSYLAIGQGVFPLLFFSGVCLAMTFYHTRLSDPWLRAMGLVMLSIAFAAFVNHFKPGSTSGFPEGSGGVIGISTSAFLQSHFNTVGTSLILLTAILVGLLLAADDLVLRAPGLAAQAYSTVKDGAPRMKFSWPSFPQAFKRQATKPVKAAKVAPKEKAPPKVSDDDEDDEKPGVLLKLDKTVKGRSARWI